MPLCCEVPHILLVDKRHAAFMEAHNTMGEQESANVTGQGLSQCDHAEQH